jgi:hypothetical protein
MDTKQAILSQYLAALEMLKQAIVKCPPALSNDPADKSPSWQLVYHALFYTHLYLQASADEFTPWAKHRDPYHRLGQTVAPAGEPYSEDDMLAYLEVCRAQAKEKIAALDVEASRSGFEWLPFGKFELQLYNLRHLEQHIGELMERLGSRAAVDVDWVGAKKD